MRTIVANCVAIVASVAVQAGTSVVTFDAGATYQVTSSVSGRTYAYMFELLDDNDTGRYLWTIKVNAPENASVTVGGVPQDLVIPTEDGALVWVGSLSAPFTVEVAVNPQPSYLPVAQMGDSFVMGNVGYGWVPVEGECPVMRKVVFGK